MASSPVALSIIIPIYNEEDSLPRLFDTLVPIMKKMNLSYEIIAVNDGSRDRSLEVLQRIAKDQPELKVVGFARNFGQTAAIMAGIASNQPPLKGALEDGLGFGSGSDARRCLPAVVLGPFLGHVTAE